MMSLKPLPPRPMPPEMALWGANHLADDDPYKLVGDLLYEDYHDQDFAELYHKEGKPALSPVLLVLVLVFQALENLSDRKAAEMVAVNLKWKYALHLPLDAGSFDASVLSDFRKRLLDHHAETQVFDQVLVQLQALGLLTPHGIQHSDSLSLLSRARDLGRLELVFETLRASLRALLKADAAWLPADLRPHIMKSSPCTYWHTDDAPRGDSEAGGLLRVHDLAIMDDQERPGKRAQIRQRVPLNDQQISQLAHLNRAKLSLQPDCLRTTAGARFDDLLRSEPGGLPVHQLRHRHANRHARHTAVVVAEREHAASCDKAAQVIVHRRLHPLPPGCLGAPVVG
jgi:transposase